MLFLIVTLTIIIAVLGIVIGKKVRDPVWQTWLCVVAPFAVALAFWGRGLFLEGESGGWSFIFFTVTVVIGLPASIIGTIIGVRMRAWGGQK